MTSPRPDLHALRRTDAGEPAPSVPRPRGRWRTRVLLPLSVIAATVAVLAYAARDVLRPTLAVHVAPVIPSAAAGAGVEGASNEGTERARGTSVVQAPGWIEPSPYAVSVPALAEGVVAEVLALEGEPVDLGQVVVRLVDVDAKLGLRAADAARDERRADVQRAEAGVAAAEAGVNVERAAADTLRDEVDRKRELVAPGGVSAGDFHRMEIRLAGLDAQVVAAQRRADEARASVGQAKAAVAAAESACDEAALRLARMEIRSPVAGVVLSRLVEPGSRINMGSRSGESASGAAGMTGTPGAVLRVYDPAKLQVRVDVPLADAAKIGIGTTAEIVTEALPDRTFTGRVTRVVHEANIQRNTVQFKVAIDGPAATLKPEMLVRVRLHGTEGGDGTDGTDGTHGTGTARSMASDGVALLAPIGALLERDDAKAACWLVDTGSGAAIARRRELVIAPSGHDGYVSVRSGLRAGDRLVVDPPAALRDGARLRVIGEREMKGATPAGDPTASAEDRP